MQCRDSEVSSLKSGLTAIPTCCYWREMYRSWKTSRRWKSRNSSPFVKLYSPAQSPNLALNSWRFPTKHRPHSIINRPDSACIHHCKWSPKLNATASNWLNVKKLLRSPPSPGRNLLHTAMSEQQFTARISNPELTLACVGKSGCSKLMLSGQT